MSNISQKMEHFIKKIDAQFQKQGVKHFAIVLDDGNGIAVAHMRGAGGNLVNLYLILGAEMQKNLSKVQGQPPKK